MPLSFLEITYFERVESQLSQLTSTDIILPWLNILDDPRKSAVVFFLCDVLQGALREEHIPQKDLFMFLSAELVELDKAPFEANYPIYFLIALTKYLGFEPAYETDQPLFFDMPEGSFTRTAGLSAQHFPLTKDEVLWLAGSFIMGKDEFLAQKLNRTERQRFTRIILDYYAHHLGGFTTPKSLKILEEVFD